MSCSFWIMRKRLAAQKAAELREAEAEKVVISKIETTTSTEEKAVTANDKRTGRKPKSRNTNK